MSSEDTEHKDLFKRNLSHGSLAALAAQDDVEADTVRDRGRHTHRQPAMSSCSAARSVSLVYVLLHAARRLSWPYVQCQQQLQSSVNSSCRCLWRACCVAAGHIFKSQCRQQVPLEPLSATT
jgi:hypothetical protein